MKKWLITLLLVVIAGSAFAKDIGMNVEFTYDPDFESDTAKFKLYYQNELVPDTIVFVAETSDTSIRFWKVPTFDLAPGKTSEFFVAAVYATGEEEMSPPFPFKFTGKPAILQIRKR